MDNSNTVPVVDTVLANWFLIVALMMLLVTVVSMVLSHLRGQRTIKVNNETQNSIVQGLEEVLEIMRSQLALNYKGVGDKLQWANMVIARAMGMDQQILLFPDPPTTESLPRYLQAVDGTGRRFLISDASPEALQRIPTQRRWPWSRNIVSKVYHPLVPLNRSTEVYRMSAVNCGQTFNLEIGDLWREHIKKELLMKEMYLYVLPPMQAKK
jgi:hypothetical protein